MHGYPCSGKTFNADYLATQGWENVDGDWIGNSTDPEAIAWGKKLEVSFFKLTDPTIELDEVDYENLKGYIKGLCD